MCVALVGRVLQIDEGVGPVRTALVSVNDTLQSINLTMTPDVRVGDDVVVHSGLAVRIHAPHSRIDLRADPGASAPGPR